MTCCINWDYILTWFFRILFLGTLVYAGYWVRRAALSVRSLFVLANEDRIARGEILAAQTLALKDLQDRQAEIARVIKVEDVRSKKEVHTQLEVINRKVDENTEMTKRAADASAEAAEVANNVNNKIDRTNKQFEQTLAHLHNGEKKSE